MKKNLKTTALLMSFLILVGCTSSGLKERELKVTTVPEERHPLTINKPEPLGLENPKYFVLTPETAALVFEEMKKQGMKPVIVGTTVDGFSTIVINNVKIQQLIQKYQDDVKAQKKYYTSPTN